MFPGTAAPANQQILALRFPQVTPQILIPFSTSKPKYTQKSHGPIKNDIFILNLNFQSLWNKRVELSNL